MSKLLDNKQIIHIVSEIFVFVGITIYFSTQNKKLLNNIRDLTQRIDDQEELIQTHEKKIAQLVSMIENLNNNFSRQTTQNPQPQKENLHIKTPENKSNIQTTKIKKNIPEKSSRVNIKTDENFANLEPVNTNSKPSISFSTIVLEKSIPVFSSNSKVEEIIDESDENLEESNEESNDESTEESLDAELEEELKDLN